MDGVCPTTISSSYRRAPRLFGHDDWSRLRRVLSGSSAIEIRRRILLAFEQARMRRMRTSGGA